jgi:hypothetical protein
MGTKSGNECTKCGHKKYAHRNGGCIQPNCKCKRTMGVSTIGPIKAGIENSKARHPSNGMGWW